MKFIDEATIIVQSGSGGAGCVSFRREKFVPRGGPDGGDGGRGGDIVLVSDATKRTLYPFRFRQHFKAADGARGRGSRKSGKAGSDLHIAVPVGTVVRDAQNGALIKDFTLPGERFLLARGGRGGRGNARFKSATHRTPRFAQPGEPGIGLQVRLELKLLADVGIIGLPNAGKSTLLQAISAARPKIGNYPFTTLTPTLGVVHTDFSEPFVVADIPGLIEGAHRGVGLGTRFLRHIERTRILLHLIDASVPEAGEVLKAYQAVNRELSAYHRTLAEKPQLVVLNKADLPVAAGTLERCETIFGEIPFCRISALTGQGLQQLLKTLINLLENTDALPSPVIH